MGEGWFLRLFLVLFLSFLRPCLPSFNLLFVPFHVSSSLLSVLCFSVYVPCTPPPNTSGLVLTLVSMSVFLVSVSPTSLSSLCLFLVSVCLWCGLPPPCSDQHSARACFSCVQRHHVPHAGPQGHEGLGPALRGPPLPAQRGAQPLLPREASGLWGSKQPWQGEGPGNSAPWPRLLPPAPPPTRP